MVCARDHRNVVSLTTIWLAKHGFFIFFHELHFDLSLKPAVDLDNDTFTSMNNYFGNFLTLTEVLKHMALSVVSEMWARASFYLFYSKDSVMFCCFMFLYGL